MHVKLWVDNAREFIEASWGESHYLVTQGKHSLGLVMLFSPHNEAELETVKTIVSRSCEYAAGTILAV